jgi:FtsZ-binding cell division protein ZapB
MSKLTDIFPNVKTDEDKEQFMSAQLATINNLTKQLEDLKRKYRQLEIELKNVQSKPSLTDEEAPQLSSQEQICQEQLRVLNEVSKDRELTAEEARKVDIYTKLLIQMQDPKKKTSSPIDKFTTEELLQIVKNDSDDGKH